MTGPSKDYKSELLKRLKDPKLAEAYVNASYNQKLCLGG
jgi:hypothetical protein